MENVQVGDELEELTQHEVTANEQLTLTWIPDADEIYQTLKAMNPYKAPGLDGYLVSIILNIGI